MMPTQRLNSCHGPHARGCRSAIAASSRCSPRCSESTRDNLRRELGNLELRGHRGDGLNPSAPNQSVLCHRRQPERAGGQRQGRHTEPVSAPMSRYVGYHQVGLEPGGNHRDAKIYLENQDEPTSADTVEAAGRSKRYAYVATCRRSRRPQGPGTRCRKVGATGMSRRVRRASTPPAARRHTCSSTTTRPSRWAVSCSPERQDRRKPEFGAGPAPAHIAELWRCCRPLTQNRDSQGAGPMA